MAATMFNPSLHILEPPYTGFGATITDSAFPAAARRGVVLAVRPAPEDSWDALRFSFETAETAFMRAAVVLWLDRIPAERSFRLAERAVRALRVRAIVHTPVPDPAALREQLTDPLDLGESCTRWLRGAGYRLGPESAFFLDHLFEHAIDHGTADGWITSTGADRFHVYRVLEHDEIGTPGAWFRVARTVRVALVLQRIPASSIPVMATQLGFSDARAVQRCVADGVGAPTTFVRARLGWKWMLLDALRRAGLGRR